MQPLSGPGQGLSAPQNLYPSQLFNAPQDWSNSRLGLPPGGTIVIPRGTWYISRNYAVLQYLDPYTNSWANGAAAGWGGGVELIQSDGFTCRLANMTGCLVGAVVVAAGTGYTSSGAGTTITPSVGTSTWAAIIGGSLSVSSLVNPGSGYGVAPLVPLNGPAPGASNANGVGGIPAAAYANIANGTVSSVSFINQGAGYTTLPTNTGTAGQIVLLPNPNDPNLLGTTAIVNATILLSLTNTGGLAGAICTNPGLPLTAAQISTGVTLTVTGAGSLASLSALVMQTVTGLMTVSNGGVGYTNAYLTTIGGAPTSSSITNPDQLGLAWRPRPAQVALAQIGSTISSVSKIYDGGLFLSTPTALILSNTSISSVAATVTLQMGGVNDFVMLQPTG